MVLASLWVSANPGIFKSHPSDFNPNFRLSIAAIVERVPWGKRHHSPVSGVLSEPVTFYSCTGRRLLTLSDLIMTIQHLLMHRLSCLRPAE